MAIAATSRAGAGARMCASVVLRLEFEQAKQLGGVYGPPRAHLCARFGPGHALSMTATWPEAGSLRSWRTYALEDERAGEYKGERCGGSQRSQSRGRRGRGRLGRSESTRSSSGHRGRRRDDGDELGQRGDEPKGWRGPARCVGSSAHASMKRGGRWPRQRRRAWRWWFGHVCGRGKQRRGRGKER